MRDTSGCDYVNGWDMVASKQTAIVLTMPLGVIGPGPKHIVLSVVQLYKPCKV